ncbi:MAG TPA: HAD family phosphatase [Bryobacteraceae bacterium]|nr:HAD family phosphatase [Bryobacteraceae bacterium]
MIKTIIFDLGKVIVPFDFQRGYDRMAPLCGYAAAEIPARLGSCDLVTRFEEGKVEPREFVKQLSAILELEAGYDEFCGIWTSIFLPETLIPEDLLIALKQRYRLLLLSNTNAIHYEMVKENYPLLRHFDHYVLSYKVGALKPSPVIYREALEHAGCRPEECFFTDDIPAYVEGAREHGIDAVQFQGLEQLEKDLRARGVSW